MSIDSVHSLKSINLKHHNFVVKLTNNCNLECTYCYRTSPNVDDNMSEETLRAFLGQIDELAVANMHFIWHGGEPLLLGLQFFQTIIELQDQSECNITNAIQTNGLLLDKHWVQFLSEAKFQVGVSIDGPEEHHLRHRPSQDRKKYYHRLIENIDLLLAANVPVGILSVITGNVMSASDYGRFLDSIPLASTGLNLDFSLACSQEYEAANRALEFLLHLYDYLCETDSLSEVREFRSVISQLNTGRNDECYNSREFCGDRYNAIGPNGDVYLCCDKAIDESSYPWANLGNLHNAPLLELISSPQAFQEITRLKEMRSNCTSDCSIGDFCKGGCVFELLRFMNRTPSAKSQSRVGCLIRHNLYNHISSDFRFIAK